MRQSLSLKPLPDRLTNSGRWRRLIYYRDLISCLVWRDIRLQYRRSALGMLWMQINPLLTLAIFSFVFQAVVPLNIPNYPAYVFSGLLAWSWFSGCLNSASYSLINNRDLIRKPQFPTRIIVVVSVTTGLINYLLALPVLIGLLLLNGLPLNWTLLMLPIVIGVQFSLTLGLALIIASLNVFFRDVAHLIGVVVGLWFYITPIFYKINTPGEFDFIINLNPMTHLVRAYRQIWMYGQPPDLVALMGLAVLAGLLLGAGLKLFERLKYSFVDEL